MSNETIDEIREIMDCLGLKHSDGYVQGKHISVILDYLRLQKKENYQRTLNKLGIKLWIQHRYLKEKLDGLEDYGIISVYLDEFNNKMWVWRGMKALRNNGHDKP